MLATQVPGGGTERTWRPPLTTRIALAIILGLGIICTAVPGLWLVLLLRAQAAPEDAGWTALALIAPACGLLAWRVLAQSVTLTPDTLVIRNILTTRHILLADIIKVGFRRGRLTVTRTHPAAGGKRRTIRAVFLPPASYLSGLRTSADAIAEEIASAAGLPPPPPRTEIISRTRAWIMFAAAALCFGLGIYCGPIQYGNTGQPAALRATGSVLYIGGAFMLGLAYRTIRDHRRKRTRQAPAR